MPQHQPTASQMEVVGGSADGGAPGLGAAKRHDRIRNVLRPNTPSATSSSAMPAHTITGQPPSIMIDSITTCDGRVKPRRCFAQQHRGGRGRLPRSAFRHGPKIRRFRHL
ncbi:hypothetical protein J3459_015981 [Metarhizium acridum]|nr:hypothetical protein J3459_015981 [Metarhizium acridum]